MHKEEKFVIAGGCATRLSDSGGDGPVILLLHGYLESLDIWDGFTELLSPPARVIALDLPGHGISEVKGPVHSMAFLADVAYGALGVLGIRRALIVGHSMGGYVALEFLRRHGEAASGLVLFHSTPYADTVKKKEDRLREIGLIEGGKKELIAKSFPHVGFAPQNRGPLAAEIEDLSEQIILTEDEGIIALLRGMSQRDDLSEMLRESAVPRLAIFGRHDEYITPDTAEAMIKAQPGMRVAWLENSGHMGFVEEPCESARIIMDFLEGVS